MLNYLARKWIALLLNGLLIAMFNNAYASSDLYEVEVNVNNQHEKARVNAVNEALKNLLVSLTAANEIERSPVIGKALNESESYLTKYSYEQHDITPDSLKLKLSFNQYKVQELLKKANLAILHQKKRPLTLVWTVAEKIEGPEIIAGENFINFEKNLLQFSEEKNLNVIFPLYDLTDSNVISASHLKDLKFDDLDKSLSRYSAEALLVIKLPLENSSETAHAYYRAAHRNTEWEVPFTSLEETMKACLEKLPKENIENKVSVNAINNHKIDEIILGVEGVGSPHAYHETVNYLQNLPLVLKVEVFQVNSTHTIFNIHFKGSKENLINHLNQEQFLAPVPTDENSNSVLLYKLAD
ncbi:MAG: hypothetical protein JWM09_755 [Francisellaceae bacterium]|nr:hypothetical protein [Francisellaceae bacterium]